MNQYDPDNLPPDGDITGTKLPAYVKKIPWYMNNGQDNLDHQRLAPFTQPKESKINEFVKRNRSKRTVATNWKPGCCRNCGASTHTEFECLERTRHKNARVSGECVVEKETPVDHNLSYDEKKDQYANYTAQRFWSETRRIYRYSDKVRIEHNQDAQRKVVIVPEYGHRGFRNRIDTADYITALDEKKTVKTEVDDLFVKPVAKEGESKDVFLMAWEGDEETRRKNRGLAKKKEVFDINDPKLINANAIDD